ncbi:polyisoprenoid-binding protein [Neokomagataea tanensis]|uniref:Polyisoprenoid-binding protein n=3 Tax=Neokomagataea TaxID=1223423 RepID=A0A4Y6VBM4_9PROT|nr:MULTISPECIES: YceI family protein [Neokomagataea]QDH25951.1 polyisoprenoid-binding protein [Neokomagataea tanensis]
MKIFTGFAAAVGLAFAAPSLVDAQTVTDPAKVQAGHYAVEAGHTQVVFSVLHFGFTNFQGLFSSASGTLDLDSKAPNASKFSITIPVSSVQTTSDKLTEELKGAQWFDAAHYPSATFVSKQVRRVGHDDAIITGDLTLHGVTKPETLKVHFVGAGVNPLDKKYTIGFDASGTIKRSDFGVKMYVPYVSDEVQLHVAGAFEKQD